MKITGRSVHKHPGHRDMVFVFGAGASYADGAPLQDEILPIILSGALPGIEGSETGREVRQFIADNFAWDEQTRVYPALESVFGFLDYFISQDEHLSASYPNAKIHAVKEGLIKLIHYVISEKSNRRAMVYRSFWETVLQHETSISILTLNYDTLLEEALQSAYPENTYIDYRIPLMNHELPGETTRAYPPVPLPVERYGDPVAIKIMKGHGSLNWKYCKCCNQVLLTPWDTKIDLFSRGFSNPCGKEYAANGENKHCCPIDGSEFETLIIPPSHIKKISHPVIAQILNEALREIRSCKKIIFVGYSFPSADVHFKALFKKGLINDQQVIVVNRTIKESLKMNYLSLSRQTVFIESCFEDFIGDSRGIREILQVNSLPFNA